MMPPNSASGRVTQWDFTAPFEGAIPHLYLDSRGNPTCGVGFLVADEAALRRLPWSPDARAAEADYQLVKVAPVGRTAEFYRQFCKARLSDAAMRAGFANRCAAVRKALADWHLERYPEGVQIALVDMAYNLGVGGLTKFVKLRQAVEARDWSMAAGECRRNGVPNARNVATAELFLRVTC